MDSGLELALYIVALVAGVLVIYDYASASGFNVNKLQKFLERTLKLVAKFIPRKKKIGIYNFNSTAANLGGNSYEKTHVGAKIIRNKNQMHKAPLNQDLIDSEEILQSEEDVSNIKMNEIITLRLVTRDDFGIDGARLKNILLECGLEFGHMNIFHYYSQNGESLFSLASATEPGFFEYNNMHTKHYKGISVFMQLMLTEESMLKRFDTMVKLCKFLSLNLNTEIQNENGHRITKSYIEKTRKAIMNVEHANAMAE